MLIKKINYNKPMPICKLLVVLVMFVSATVSISAEISETDKPVDNCKVKKAIKQPTIAGMIKYRTNTNYNINWKEAPFVETVAEPVFTSAESKRGYMIFRRAISDIVYPNTKPKPYERINSLSGFGCRDEFQSLTFTLYPKRRMKNLKVRISDLKMGNKLIPSSAIAVKLQTYWKMPYPTYFLTKNFRYRRSPELLEIVTQHSSPARECQRYLLTVRVPDKAKAGLYTGSVTVWDDGYKKAIKIPVNFRVMSFDLKKDPEKHFSACVTDDIYLYNANAKTAEQKKWNEWVLKASENNYRSMIDHGFDVPMMIFSIEYNNITDEVFIHNEEIMIETMQKAGFDFKKVPFVFALGDVPIDAIIRKYTKNKKYRRTSHWAISEEMMPEDFVYKKISEIFKKFNDKWMKKGYPKFYFCPLDENRASAWKFGVKVFSAIKKSGMKVFTTKSPAASDARYYKNIVDVFCSQSFNPQYNEIVKDKNTSYWCYPNHNSNEVCIPTVKCNGGRMTYGFGLWKSGYKAIMPWAWSSWHENPKMLRKITHIIMRGKANQPVCNARCGNVYDDELNVINTIYWECFREGYDDGRYIYTLQQAIVERENTKDKECRKLVNEGKELLQNIWDSIKTEQKYKGPGSVSILPEEFDNLRWQMAVITEKLSKYKGQKGIIAPSVVLNTKNNNQTESIFSREKKRGNLLIRDLGDEDFGLWKSYGYGVKVNTVSDRFTSGKKCMKMDIVIDHKRDEKGGKTDTLIGWPEVYASFKKDKLDITKYEFFKYNIMVDSDRDEVADDMTSVYWNFISAVKGNRLTSFNLGQVPQRTWIPVMIPLTKLINNGKGIRPWKLVSKLQFGTQERDYADGTKLTFYLDEISLIRFKKPVLNQIKITSTIVIPANRLSYQISVLGTAFIKKGEYRLDTKLIDSSGKLTSSSSIELMDYNKPHSLNVNISKKGKYTLIINIVNNKSGKTVSTWIKIIPTIVNSAMATNKSGTYTSGKIDEVLFSKDMKTLVKYPNESNKKTYVIPKNVQHIGNKAFSGCNLSSVTIPSSVKTIGGNAFYECKSLSSINIPGSVQSIGGRAFYGCKSLSTVKISSGVKTIGRRAFVRCESLSSINIPSSVQSIGERAFYGCKSLSSIKISSGVKTIGAYAFEKCESLSSVTIPNSVTTIGRGAFERCKSLASVNIPNVETIAERVFYGCKLSSVTIPSSVKTIEGAAFYACKSLSSIKISSGVKTIGAYAFYGCKSLSTVTIPKGIKIENHAFDGCPWQPTK